MTFSLSIIKKILKYVTGISALDKAPSIAKEKGLDAALHYLKKKYTIYSPALATFLKNLYIYLVQLEKSSIECLPSNKKDFIIHFCVWGTNYCEKVEKMLLPSLLAADNLAWATKDHQLMLLIHCDKKSKKSLQASNVIKHIQQQAHVHFLLIPEKLLQVYKSCFNYPDIFMLRKLNNINRNIKYLLLGGLQNHAFQIARHRKAIISFLAPDMLLSNNLLKIGLSELQGKKVVLTTAFRTSYEAVKKEVQPYYVNRQLSIDAPTLVELNLKYIHPSAKRQIVSEKTKGFFPSGQLIFTIPRGYIIRALHYHPILMDCGQIENSIKPDYFPIDNAILNSLLAENLSYEQQITVLDNPSICAFIELSDNSLNQYQAHRDTCLNYSQLLHSVGAMINSNPLVYNTLLNRYLRSFKYTLSSTEIIHDALDCLDSDVFFSDLG